MLSWLKRRAYLRSALYPYFDGRHWRRADPIAINVAFALDPEFDVEKHWPQVAQDNPDPEALRSAIHATARAFGLEVWNPKTGRGLTADELLDLFMDFADWVEVKKKTGSLLPICARRMEQILDDYDEPTTQPTSDYGSTKTAPDFDPPGKSTEQSDGRPSEVPA